MDHKCIIRHTVPTKYDTAPYGTLCQSNTENECKLFIQLSHTEEAQWEPIGYLLEQAFLPLLTDAEFVQELLNLIPYNDPKCFKQISLLLLRK